MKGRPSCSPTSKTVQILGVAEGGGGSSLPLEAFSRQALGQVLLREELQSDLAAESCVFGLVYDAHTSAAQLAEDAVVRDGFADHGSRERLDYDCEVCDSLACF